MASQEQRRRQLARAKYERQQQRREVARRKTKRRNTVIASSLAVVLTAGVVVAAAGAFSGDDDKGATPNAVDTPTPPPTPDPKPEPSMTIDKKAKYGMALKTNHGDIRIAMDAAKTPRTVNSFKSLADKHFFDGSPCHRLAVEGIFVLQCGDPDGTGRGGPGYTIPDENLKDPRLKGGVYPRGTVAMANRYNGVDEATRNSGSSQFFLVYKDSKLPPNYTPFGTLDAEGLKVLEKIAAGGVEGGVTDGAPKKAVTIEKATVQKD
ncbi:peptidylprolyl isomerase [Streptomyces sp. SAJ15]|uniref:peptidylprolyl isomerase n=1 Tax=Streptomyces sp. SAJ15 TaxID=2011095 RepID=UPI001184A54E|nr:peptidylprolyl isomerase [Streptomyces sp. SAJ15]TVL93172.1 peptidylprolyl isomerase [Streptomyces sp. SAJ15]